MDQAFLSRLDAVSSKVQELSNSLERARIESLKSTKIMDSPHERVWDTCAQLAAEICNCPMAGISFLDSERQWYKSTFNINVKETKRCEALCDRTITHPNVEITIIHDTKAVPDLEKNPFVTGPLGVRFYAASPIVDRSGFALGALCVLDTKPRGLSPRERSMLIALKKIVAKLLFV
jgi:GAF domain-containing protein